MYPFTHHDEKLLTKRFVVENELDPCGNISEDVEGEEEDEGDRGNLIGKTHLQSSYWSQYWMKDKFSWPRWPCSDSEKSVKGPVRSFSGFAHSPTLHQKGFDQ